MHRLTNRFIYIIILLKIFPIIYGKTYYFKAKRNNSNEFHVYNRINFNRNEYENGTAHHSDIANNYKLKNAYYLDEEWDYDWRWHNKSALPNFIHKLYTTINEKIKNKIFVREPKRRIVFNSAENNQILEFNFDTTINENENITDCNLHLYLSIDNRSELYKTSIILRLFQIENSTESIEMPDLHKLLNVIYIFQAESGWQNFRIRRNIFDGIQENLQLFITISTLNEDTHYEVFNDSNRDHLRTFMIITTENDEEEYKLIAATIIETKFCKKYNTYVNFEKLGMDKLVIAPKNFTAFKCLGKCQYNDLSTTNHAKLLNIIPERTRTVCCVPTKYYSLPIMFYDQYGNVVIKIYDNMIVAECGCR